MVVLRENLAHAPLLCGQTFLERRLSVRERALRIVELLDERGGIRVGRRANVFGEDVRGARLDLSHQACDPGFRVLEEPVVFARFLKGRVRLPLYGRAAAERPSRAGQVLQALGIVLELRIKRRVCSQLLIQRIPSLPCRAAGAEVTPRSPDATRL